MILLSLTAVAKRFPSGTEALRSLTFAVGEGEFVSLLGPSGCGKSTALRLIAGLLPPDSGTVNWPERKPPIGFVFQDATLMPWADALANVRLPLDLQHVPRAEGKARAAAALARVGLSGFEHAYPRELSGGMKMRVSIARALVTNPKLLLMDEPFAALDEITRQKLNDDVLELWRRSGVTVVFVTHSVFESAYLSNRIVVMRSRPGQVYADLPLETSATRSEAYRTSEEYRATTALVSKALQDAIHAGGGNH
jgi:NitT/TauT family transport system ATP-binding protein